MKELKKGLVIEATPVGSVTVLTAQGDFLNLDWSTTALPQVGSEVEFTMPVLRKKKFAQKQFLAIAACFLMLLLGASVWAGLIFPQPRQVVAYVNMDINPSIELAINKNAKVIEVTGLNEDGVRLLEKLNLINLSSQEAVGLVTAEAVKEGYLADGKENAVLITVSGEKKVSDKVNNLEKQVEKVLTENKLAAETNQLKVSSEIRDRAKELDVSPGKYVILMEAVDQGLDLTLEDIKGSSITKAIKDSGGIPGQVISGAKKDIEKIKEVQNRFEKKMKEREKNRETFSPRSGSEKPNTDKNARENSNNVGNDTDKSLDKETGKETDKNTEKDAGKNISKRTDRNANIDVDIDVDRNIDRNANTDASRNADRITEKGPNNTEAAGPKENGTVKAIKDMMLRPFRNLR